MAALSPTAGSTSGLTPAQVQALQSALSQFSNPTGQTDSQIANGIVGDLGSSGTGFTPDQLQKALSAFGSGATDTTDKWGGLPGDTAAWGTNIENALGGVSNAGNPTASNPALLSALTQPGYLGTPTAISPTMYGGTSTYQPAQQSGTSLGFGNVDPSLLAALAPGGAISALQSAFAPQVDQQERNLNQTLAGLGIQGGAAINAQDQLQGQIAAGEAPSIANLISGSQNNLLSAANQGSGLAFNTGANNTSALNTALQQFYQGAQQTGLANTGFANNATTANVGAINATDASNLSTFNGENSALLNALLQQYQQQQQSYTGLLGAGLGANNQISVGGANNFQIPTGAGAGTSGLFGALGSIYAPRATAPAQTPTPAPAPAPAPAPGTGDIYGVGGTIT